MFDEDYCNLVNKERRQEEREIKKYALAQATKISDPVRRQAKYNAIRFPQETFVELTEEQLTMPY